MIPIEKLLKKYKYLNEDIINKCKNTFSEQEISMMNSLVKEYSKIGPISLQNATTLLKSYYLIRPLLAKQFLQLLTNNGILIVENNIIIDINLKGETKIMSKLSNNQLDTSKNKAITDMLITNMKDFEGFIGDFKSFISNNVSELDISSNSSPNDSLIKSMEDQVNKNKELNDNIKKLENERNMLKNLIAQEEKNSAILRENLAKQRNENTLVLNINKKQLQKINDLSKLTSEPKIDLNRLIVNIESKIEDYIKTAEWKKNLAFNNSFQDDIINTIQKAIK